MLLLLLPPLGSLWLLASLSLALAQAASPPINARIQASWNAPPLLVQIL